MAMRMGKRRKEPKKIRMPQNVRTLELDLQSLYPFPSGAITGFMAFSNATRSKVKAENPSLSVTDIAKELGARWKALTTEDKEPFEQIARDDKERYKEEMKVYNANKGGKGGDEGDDGDAGEEDDNAMEVEDN